VYRAGEKSRRGPVGGGGGGGGVGFWFGGAGFVKKRVTLGGNHIVYKWLKTVPSFHIFRLTMGGEEKK